MKQGSRTCNCLGEDLSRQMEQYVQSLELAVSLPRVRTRRLVWLQQSEPGGNARRGGHRVSQGPHHLGLADSVMTRPPVLF